MNIREIKLGRRYIESSKERWSERGRSGEWDRIVADPNSYVNAGNANVSFKQALLELVKGIRRTTRSLKVLDIGCGTGNMTQHLFSSVPCCNVIGVDIAEGMIEKAKEKFPQGNWCLMESRNMPFPEESFDLVFSRGVLPSHLGGRYWKKVCKEVYDLLRPGGYFMFDFLSSEYKGPQPEHKILYDLKGIQSTFEGMAYELAGIKDAKKKNAIVILGALKSEEQSSGKPRTFGEHSKRK